VTPGNSVPFSIDWEDWFQLCCAPFDAPDALDRYTTRLPIATEKALAFCREFSAEVTWFCLADQARRHPHLIRLMVDEGHHVALHGLTHRRATSMDRAGFRTFLKDSRAIVEDISGTSVRGFRAPEWSLRGPAEAYWEEIRDQGFLYDSSLAPLAFMGSTHRCREARLLAEGFWEMPPPVAGLGPFTVPLWGWGARVLPERLLRRKYEAIARRGSGTPLILHPWELDEDQPKLPGEAGFAHRFAHCAGLRGYGTRLRRLLNGFQLVSLETWLSRQGEKEAH